MQIKEVLLEHEQSDIRHFLARFQLQYEPDVDETIALFDDYNQLIATASSAARVIKCVAIDPNHQGKNIAATLITEMIKRLNARGIHHIFVYTRPEQEALFKALGFKVIVHTMNMALLERGDSIEARLNRLKENYGLNQGEKACVVINANPMTKGHHHLISTAAKNHEHVLVFVVEEDRSFFPFSDRFDIVSKTCAPLTNVTVLPTDRYLVSYASFPKYFLTQEQHIEHEHALIDVLIFKTYYMKIFNIKTRHVGEEPYSPMTNAYNETMKQHLNTHLIVHPRLTLNNRPISAQTVRQFLAKDHKSCVRDFVVEATYDYLLSKKGDDIIEHIKRAKKRH